MPLIGTTKGETAETDPTKLPPPIEPLEDSDAEGNSNSEEDEEPSSSEEEPVVASGPPAGLPPPPQFLPPPMALPSEPPAIEEGATEAEKTPSVDELASKFYKVLWEYPNEAKDEDTLTLHVGDILVVLETNSDGWWRGQSGDVVGLFPVAYTEPVGEEEVKAFIKKLHGGGKKAAATPVVGAGSRAELEREMKDLQAEEALLSAQAKQLKDEVAGLKQEALKLRKKTREELLETFDTLPAAMYQIPLFSNTEHDVVRCVILIALTLDIDSDHKELLPVAITQLSNFVGECTQLVTAEPKLKTEVDKIVSKVLALQKFLLDEHANTNVDLPRKVAAHLELLASQINAYAHGELDTSNAKTTEILPHKSNTTTPRTPQSEISSPTSGDSPKKRSKSPSKAASPRDDHHLEEDGAISPREKKKKKKDRPVSLAVPAADGEDQNGGKDKKKKKKDGAASPRKSKMVDDATVAELASSPHDDAPLSPRSKDKKSKKKKSEEEADDSE